MQVIVPTAEILTNIGGIEMNDKELPEKYREVTYAEEINFQQNVEEALKFTVCFVCYENFAKEKPKNILKC